jgi:hypothetical protein
MSLKGTGFAITENIKFNEMAVLETVQKKNSACAPNSGRIDGASLRVHEIPNVKVIT